MTSASHITSFSLLEVNTPPVYLHVLPSRLFQNLLTQAFEMPEPGLDILGKRLGNWKVLLSPKALKSIQSFSRSGQVLPVH